MFFVGALSVNFTFYHRFLYFCHMWQILKIFKKNKKYDNLQKLNIGVQKRQPSYSESQLIFTIKKIRL